MKIILVILQNLQIGAATSRNQWPINLKCSQFVKGLEKTTEKNRFSMSKIKDKITY